MTLGPGIVAAGAVGGAALVSLASAAGFAALGAGTLVAGFSGVFDTLDLLNKAQLEPTEANLEALRQSMQQLSPDARDMVREIDKLGPVLRDLRDASAEGIAPELERGVDNLLAGLPRLTTFFEVTANAAAGVLADGAGILTSDRWQPFLDFVEREAPRAIESLGGSAGDVAHGLAEVWRALDPLNDDGLRFIEKAADGFDRWASGLKGSPELRQFTEYVRENGPLLAEAMQDVAGAVLDIAEAAAPLGGPVLRSISAIAEGVSAVADSEFGTPFLTAAASLVAINRGLRVAQGLAKGIAGMSLLGGLAGRGKGSASGGLAGAVATGAAAGAAGGDAPGKTRPGIAKTAGAGILGGLIAAPFIDDVTSSYDGLDQSVNQLATSLRQGEIPSNFQDIADHASKLSNQSGVMRWFDDLDRKAGVGFDGMKEMDAEIAALDSALGKIASNGGVGKAQKAFDNLADSLDLSGGQRSDLLSQLPTMGKRLSSFSGDVGQVSSKTRRLAEDLFHLGDTNPKVKIDFDKSINGAIDGVSKALRGVDKQDARPRVSLDDNPFAQNYNRVRGSINTLDRAKPTPTADLNDNPFTGKRAQVMAALGVTDRFTANPTANLTDNASGKAASITNQLNNIPRSISTTVTTYFRQIGKAFQQRADGGWMSGPGGPRDDAIPTMLSNGEFVVNAAAAARNAALLEQINSGGRQSAAAASAQQAPQSVSVSFDDARVMVQGPDGRSQQVQLMARVADERIDNWERSERARAGL